MNIYQKGKSKYITLVIDGKDYNITTGHFKRKLDQLGISLPDYFEKYEKIVRTECEACKAPAEFKGYNSDNTIKWHSVCGAPECAKVMYSRAHLSRTPENWAAASQKRRQTFKDHPEVLEERTRIIDESNRKVGKDGLTGYERCAKKRAETLLREHGHAYYANWEKTKQTWVDKPEDEIAAHGKKISDSWDAKSEEQKRDEIGRREQTKLEKYGKPGWKIAYDSSKGRYSFIATDFCAEIQRLLPDRKLIFGSEEFCISHKYYDLACTFSKKIIEFNGDFWHAKPTKYSADDVIPISGKIAKQIWEADAEKMKLAEDNGYQVKVVWESDYKKNPKKVIQECVEWLKR